MEVIRRRIQQARQERKLSQFALATDMGDYTQQMISGIEQGRSKASVESLLAAARALKVSTDYLYGLTDDPTPAVERFDVSKKPTPVSSELSVQASLGELCDHGFFRLARRTVAAAAGWGAVVEDEPIEDYLAFRKEWVWRHNLNPANFSVIDVTGDSMEPTLMDGALILVDHQRNRRANDRIFVVRTEDRVVVKRAVGVDKSWLLMSDNSTYKPQAWKRDNVVVGQVMWTGRTV